MIQVCLSLCNWISDHDDNNNQWIDASRIRKKKKNRLSISQVRWWHVIFFSSSSLIVSDTRQFLLLLLVFFLFHTIQLETILNASLSYEQFIERERKRERMTVWPVQSCSLYIHVMAIGRWERIDGTTYTRKEEHTCKECVHFLFTAVDLFCHWH